MVENSIYFIVFIGILIIILAKPVFNIFAYFTSFVFFHFLADKINRKDNKNISEKSTVKKNTLNQKIKNILGWYVSGLIFYSILQTGKISFHLIRNLLYKNIFKVKMGKNAVIYGGCEIRSPQRLKIGKGSVIGHFSVLDARNIIEIGENVNFSHGVWLWTLQHNHNSSDFNCESSKNQKIKIGNRAWLGPRVIVLPGCTIGEGAVIGAGAVVTKDIEPYTINVGIPARKVGERNRCLTYEFNGNPLPFI